MPHVEGPHRRFATDCKCLVEQLFQGFAVRKSLFELRGFLLQLTIIESLHFRFQLIYPDNPLLEFLDDSVVTTAE